MNLVGKSNVFDQCDW